jgi:hypothetical protein
MRWHYLTPAPSPSLAAAIANTCFGLGAIALPLPCGCWLGWVFSVVVHVRGTMGIAGKGVEIAASA